MSKLMKRTLMSLMILTLFSAAAALTMMVSHADDYYTIRINYIFEDGSRAHDPYIGTYHAGDPVDITVTNPKIDGYVPMTALEGGVSAETSTFQVGSLDGNHTETVYYIAGLTHYRVMYYKQNINDDLYTRDYTVASEYTDRYGYTGTNPTELESENLFEGFTNLFHEPDAIAADGSTVFRVYYDRNYYSVLFDLGDKGYGVDPIYAKFQYPYHISEPKRLGYIFKGWARTDADSSSGEEGTDWHYIDENGSVITPEEAARTAFTFFEGEVPSHDTYYKAIWEATETQFSIVYWLENTDSTLDISEVDSAATLEQSRAIIGSNYSVIATKIVSPVISGSQINQETEITNVKGENMKVKDFFDYDLTESGDFPDMSTALRNELLGKSKYYDYYPQLSALQFTGSHEDEQKTHLTVSGDGTTRINIYYKRKTFTMKFYYARQGFKNGEPDPDQISLTNSTKTFSGHDYKNRNALEAIAKGPWSENIAETMPRIKDKYRAENGGTLTELYEDYTDANTLYRFWYYQVEAKYGASLEGKWLVDAFTDVHKKGYAENEMCRSGSWAVEYGTYYYYSHTSVNNYSIKGFYEKLGNELMFKDTKTNYTELHYLVSWTNTNRGNNWNGKISRVLNFTYENYVELLPRELDMIADTDGDGTPDDPQALIDSEMYESVIPHTVNGVEKWYGLKTEYVPLSPYELAHKDTDENGNNIPDLIDDHTFIKIKYVEEENKWYGLKSVNRIETTDSGDQYDRDKTLEQKNANVRSNQTAAELTGFTIEDYRLNAKGQIILNDNNTDIDWSRDTDYDRHATIKFFYKRNKYTLKYYNSNRLEEDYTHEVMYGAPLNSKDAQGNYRYYYEKPTYFNPDLVDYYTFEGWYYTPYYYRQVNINNFTMPAEDVILYAKWDPKEINVTFYPTYNDFYADVHKLDNEEHKVGETFKVNYGSFIPTNRIPADTDSSSLNRPLLIPPADEAMFAGWYYLRDNIPMRFDPESIPVTALTKESSEDEGNLWLYAEWVTRDVAKYQITYVEKDHPENEVAPPTTGRAFVWKTRTFNAKCGSELNESHRFNENDTRNWWPTANSHSLVIKANQQGHEYEYMPNVYSFEYIQKSGVYYRVQYLDAVTRTPLRDPLDECYTTHASVKEDAPFIPGYVAEELSKTLVLSASDKSTPEAQKADELANNVITFYYRQNDSEYLYEVEYYKQNIDNDGYTFFQKDDLEVAIAPEGQDTTLAIQSLFDDQTSVMIEEEGFTRRANATEVTVSDETGATETRNVADDASVVITGTTKTTIKLYFDRNTYPYRYQYIDYSAERAYLDATESEREGMWNGVMESHDGAQNERVEKTVSIPAPQDLTYGTTPYTLIGSDDVTLMISPASESNPDINLVKVYYRKFNERELQYKLVCANEDDPASEIDYDETTGDPLYGGLSLTIQTVDNFDNINSVTFYNFNDAKVTLSGSTSTYKHLHRYTFKGWYTNPEGTGTPLTVNPVLTKEDLGLDGELPARDTTYYAVVEQDMVKAYFELRYVEEDLPEDDAEASAIVASAPTDADGSITGSYFMFTDPANYENNTNIPWHRNSGYSLKLLPNDNRVYKYELTEWWEEDTSTHTLIRKHNWHNSEWAPTELEKQLDRHGDKHVIAVFKRREVTELPYTITYKFTGRDGTTRSYVKTGTLEGDQLKENTQNAAVNSEGAFELTDEFIMKLAPYESNHAKVITWTNKKFTKTSRKSDGTEGSVDMIYTEAVAQEDDKPVAVYYTLTPNAKKFSYFKTAAGNNRLDDPNIAKLDVRDTNDGSGTFLYWAIRKSPDDDAPIIAKCYEPLFSLRIWDDYYITPVFGEEGDADGEESTPSITLCALDNTRNQWTDENGNMLDNAYSDYLYCDLEAAFSDGSVDLYNNPDYEGGFVFEICGKYTDSETPFDPDSFNYFTNDENLKAGILSLLQSNPEGGNGKFANTNPEAGTNANRSINVSPVPTSQFSTRSRVHFTKPYRNVYKTVNGEKSYTNGSYIYKVRAYLIKNGTVTLSNPVYVNLYGVATQDLATNDMCVIVP